MSKSSLINTRIETTLKQVAKGVLYQLGIRPSQAVYYTKPLRVNTLSRLSD